MEGNERGKVERKTLDIVIFSCKYIIKLGKKYALDGIK